VRLLATSRFLSDIVDEFKDSGRLEIRASDDDVRQFVAGQIDRLPGCIRRSSELQKMVQDGIAEAVDGMYVFSSALFQRADWRVARFLLGRLHTDSLLDKKTAKHVKTALARLSKGSAALDDAYRDAIQRIESQLPGDSQQARKVLSWITHAQRPLSTVELCSALAVEPAEEEIDSENIPYIEDIVSVCAGLIAVDEESSIIRLVHYTTQEFFDRIRDAWIPGAQLDIASTCLTCLSFAALRSYSYYDEHCLEQNPFLGYAAQYWGQHTLTVQEELSELACSFLRDEALVNNAARLSAKLHDRYLAPRDGNTGLHVTAQCGWHSLVSKLLSISGEEILHAIEARDGHGRTALSLAAEHGHESVVELLLDNGADIHAQRGPYGDALQTAAYNGHEKVMGLLLGRGANINAKGGTYGNALQTASLKGHTSIVKLLLENGAYINAGGEEYGNALQAATFNGHTPVVKPLLSKGADLHAQSGRWGYALHAASAEGHEHLIQFLLTTGADINAQGRELGTALQVASLNGRKRVVEFLLSHGADINARGGEYDTALQAASCRGNQEIVRMLIDNGADVNA
jgi:ankyrin repeat protein